METKIYRSTWLRGRIEDIGPVTKVGEQNTDLQHLILFCPARNDGFERIGRDNMFALQALGKKVQNLDLLNKFTIGQIVNVKVYVDGQFVEPKTEGQTGFYSVNLTIDTLEAVK